MLEQLLLQLRRAGLVEARRGRYGGYRLGRPARDIPVAAVLEAVAGGAGQTAPLPAGLAHMSQWRFLAFTFAGAAVWNALLIEGGRRLAGIAGAQRIAGDVVIWLAAAMAVWYLWRVATWKPRG